MKNNEDTINNNINVIEDSQIKINALEEEIKKLELQKVKITKRKNNRILRIMYKYINSLILCFGLILYISSFIDKITIANTLQKNFYIAEIYIGVITFSIIGALLSAKIGDKIKASLKRKIKNLSEEINEKELEIKYEKEKQNYQSIPIQQEPQLLDDNLQSQEEHIKPYTKVRTRYRNKYN